MLSEIPLESPDANLSSEDDVWRDQYKTRLLNAQREIHTLLKTLHWHVVPKCATERIKMYTCHSDGVRRYKIKGELHCDAQRLMQLHTETHFDVRQHWDTPDLQSIQQHETYMTQHDGHFKIIDATFAATVWWYKLFCKPWHVMGVQRTTTHNDITRSIFCTCKHRFLNTPEHHFPVRVKAELMVKPLSGTTAHPTRCFARMYVDIDTSNPIYFLLITRFETYLQHLLLRYETLACESWDDFYSAEEIQKRDATRRGK